MDEYFTLAFGAFIVCLTLAMIGSLIMYCRREKKGCGSRSSTPLPPTGEPKAELCVENKEFRMYTMKLPLTIDTLTWIEANLGTFVYVTPIPGTEPETGLVIVRMASRPTI